MKAFKLKTIEKFADFAATEPPSGDEFFEERYQEDFPIIGHTNPYYHWFRMIAEKYRPRLTVELGTYRAVAAMAFASGNPKGEVITIDIHREDKIAQQKAISAAEHYPNLTYINKWTKDAVGDVAEVVERLGHGIDLLYIDAWHEYKYFKEDWGNYTPLMSDLGLVLCDDIFDSEGTTDNMVKAFEEIEHEKSLVTHTGLHDWIPMGLVKYVH